MLISDIWLSLLVTRSAVPTPKYCSSSDCASAVVKGKTAIEVATPAAFDLAGTPVAGLSSLLVAAVWTLCCQPFCQPSLAERKATPDKRTSRPKTATAHFGTPKMEEDAAACRLPLVTSAVL